ACTLLGGRRRFEHRRVVVAQTGAEAADALEALDGKRVFTAHSRATERRVVFMFPGQGAQYVDMSRGLHEKEAVFRKHLDERADASCNRCPWARCWPSTVRRPNSATGSGKGSRSPQ